MATELTIRGAEVKTRSAAGVFLLALVTFGIYYIVWYYKINRELRDYGERVAQPNPLDVEPGTAVLAITLGGFLIIPPFVSEWRTFKRIARAQELAEVERRISHTLGFVLYLIGVFFLPIEMVYAQQHLNALWAAAGRRAEMESYGVRSSV